MGYTGAFGGDCYDIALAGGAELGETKGYRAALDDVHEAAEQVVLTDMVRMSYGLEVKEK